MRFHVSKPDHQGTELVVSHARIVTGARQFIGRHPLRYERRVVETVLGMEPPSATVEMPALLLQSMVQGRARVRPQTIVGRKNGFALQGESRCRRNGFLGVVVVPKGKGRPGLHAVSAQNSHLLLVMGEARDVRGLLCFTKAVPSDGFKSRDIAPVARTLEQLH